MSDLGRAGVGARLAAVVAFPLAVCCGAVPNRPAERGLYLDVRKIVQSTERMDWIVDRIEIEHASPAVMRSACQVSPDVREALLDWLEERIAEEGGPAEEAYERSGRDLSAIDDLIELERTRAVLLYAHAHADDDCPFWLREDPHFQGVQGDAARLVLLVESMGSGAIFLRGGDAALGGAGGGRILPSWGLDHRVTVGLGAEVGGTGALPETAAGTRELEMSFAAAVPALLRVQDGTWMYDVEIAGTSRLVRGEFLMPPALRFAGGVGISTLRGGDLMPYGLVWIGYEIQPARDGIPAEHTFRLGTRFGVDWAP